MPLLDRLKGYRTYLAAAAAALALFAQQAGLLDSAQADALLKAAAILFGVFLRAAVLSAGDAVLVATPDPDATAERPLPAAK